MRRILALISVTAMMLALTAMPAMAAPLFTGGLVNVNIAGNNVLVPVGVAVNICNVNAAVIAENVEQEGAACEADADALALVPPRFQP